MIVLIQAEVGSIQQMKMLQRAAVGLVSLIGVCTSRDHINWGLSNGSEMHWSPSLSVQGRVGLGGGDFHVFTILGSSNLDPPDSLVLFKLM